MRLCGSKMARHVSGSFETPSPRAAACFAAAAAGESMTNNAHSAAVPLALPSTLATHSVAAVVQYLQVVGSR